MLIVTSFNPTVAASGQFNMSLPGNRGKIVVWNESNTSISLTFSDGSNDYVPAWTAILFCIDSQTSNLVNWNQELMLSSNQAPAAKVIVVQYDWNENVSGTFPATLSRQTNVGNASTVTTAASSIQNDNNVPGTSLLEATPNDAATSTVTCDNAGNWTIKGDNAGVLTTLLQLVGGASPSVKTGAPTTIQSTLGVTGASSLDNGAITTDGAGNITALVGAILSGQLQLTGNQQTFNGSNGGSAVFRAPIWSTEFKCFIVMFAGFDTAAGHAFALPTTLARFAWLQMTNWASGGFGCKFQNSGGDIDVHVLTGLSTSLGATTQQLVIPGYSIGSSVTTVDSFVVQSTNNSTCNGVFFCIGR